MANVDRSPASRNGCQLMGCTVIGREPWPWCLRRQAKVGYQAMVNFTRYLRRKARGGIRKLRHAWCAFSGRQDADVVEDQSTKVCSSKDNVSGLMAGDLVRVRSREVIEKTLDIRHRCRGCPFADPMFRYCGQEFRVVKRVERFFDEAKRRLVKCKNIVLLEGVFCDGRGYPESRGCDRMCYYFWHTDWLERIENHH